jgi:hypothetical protein
MTPALGPRWCDELGTIELFDDACIARLRQAGGRVVSSTGPQELIEIGMAMPTSFLPGQRLVSLSPPGRRRRTGVRKPSPVRRGWEPFCDSSRPFPAGW